jgi:hypothetical protein
MDKKERGRSCASWETSGGSIRSLKMSKQKLCVRVLQATAPGLPCSRQIKNWHVSDLPPRIGSMYGQMPEGLRHSWNNGSSRLEVEDLLFHELVWTPCLMHRCVYIWWYILQNYNYKLHFQNLSIYITFCTYPWGPWPLKILMFALLVTHRIATYSRPWEKTGDSKYMLGLLLILIQNFGGAPPGARHAFPRQWHMRRRGWGFYFCQGFLPCMMPSMDGWRDGWMDGKLHEKRTQRPLLYVILLLMGSN